MITSTGDQSSASGWWIQHLEFVAGWVPADPVRAGALDLKAFVTVSGKDR